MIALATALGASACKPVIIGGGSGGGGEGGSGGGGEGGSGGAGNAVNALGVPYVLFPQTPPGNTGSSGSGGTITIDPSTLYVQIGNFSQTCSTNQLPFCAPGLNWQVSIGIPPALQVPGVLQLSNPGLISTFSEDGPNGPNADNCGSGGGGSFIEGTMEILSIDAGTIVVKLTGTTPGLGDFHADGEYTAPICPTGV